MSVDLLQEKIRKAKNPSAVVLEAFPEQLPEGFDRPEGFGEYYARLLQAVKGLIPAVRFGFGSFALLGGGGLEVLSALTREAKRQGFYVLLDVPELLSPRAAENLARKMEESVWEWDALVISPWLGSDVIKPFLELCRKGRAVFCAVRSGNRSAFELQDLLSGSRLVHTAAADLVTRHGEASVGKFGFSNLGAMASAGSPDSLRSLRTKYPRMFLLLDGYDYSFGNSKNCALAFDKLGRGAVVCAGDSVVRAWAETPEKDPAEAAREAAERMKRNLGRYITVL